MVELDEKDLLPCSAYQFPVRDNKREITWNDQIVSMRVAVDAFLNDPVFIWYAQVRVSFAVWIFGITNVVVVILLFRIRKAIEDALQIGHIAERCVGSYEVLFILIHPYAAGSVMGLQCRGTIFYFGL